MTNDNKLATEFVVGAATYHGRILVLNREDAKESTGHGSPLPMLVHGGPGRAGGGEEMGGMRGVMHYLQRCAIQGTPTTLTEITSVYQYGGHCITNSKTEIIKNKRKARSLNRDLAKVLDQLWNLLRGLE